MIKRQWLLIAGLVWSACLMAEEPVSKSFFGNVAVGGMDVIAYRQQEPGRHETKEGKSRFTVEWRGAKWRFMNQTNADLFRADPVEYVPTYNGFCANALSLGNGLVKTDGTHWQIFDGQLFLFYSREGRQRWLEGDYLAYKREADNAWKTILEKQQE